MKREPAPPRRPRRPGSSPAAREPVLTKRYIEASALAAAILEGDTAAKASIRAQGQRVTSVLTVAETSRAVLRARLSGRITDQ